MDKHTSDNYDPIGDGCLGNHNVDHWRAVSRRIKNQFVPASQPYQSVVPKGCKIMSKERRDKMLEILAEYQKCLE